MGEGDTTQRLPWIPQTTQITLLMPRSFTEKWGKTISMGCNKFDSHSFCSPVLWGEQAQFLRMEDRSDSDALVKLVENQAHAEAS